MDWLSELIRGLAGGPVESVFRLVLAAALGGLVGLEREASGKPAGFRTNLLICVGAALVTELSIVVASDITLPGGFRSDPGRLAAQIVSGIGFLGAGTIIQARGSVVGLTTAATLWVVAALGMAVGAGAYLQAIVGTTLVLAALMVLGRFEDLLLPYHYQERILRVTMEQNQEMVDGVEKYLADAGYSVRVQEIERQDDLLIVSLSARGHRHHIEVAMRELAMRPGILKVTLGGR
ncbi:MAG TPA: MgtC/SapB family protein [Longimicrobiales bacterium]|nr:MgtC/SapB family protein [Longimicrobiales bacterium]